VPHFSINTGAELSRLLLVAPAEITEVIQNRHRYYRNIRRGKADGSVRILRVPEGPLKLLQDKIRRHVLDQIAALDCVHGGVKGRSVMTNAKPHVGKRIVFTLDVKNFFPGVGPRTVNTIFRALGFGAEALDALVDATTWDDQLPQGAPTSVGIANLAMYRVDVRLSHLARQQGFAYTRYVDDLALSGSRRILDFRRLTQRIVEEEGFRVNAAKLKTMPAGIRQLVTGIVVNEKMNLPREQRDLIRGRVLRITPSSPRSQVINERIRGQLAWLSSVNPQQALRLQRRSTRHGSLDQAL
jgi:retron-type reverse transcriptase